MSTVMKPLALALALAACTKTERAKDVTPSPAMSADARARQILDAQIAALRSRGDAIVATFSPDAIVLVPDAREAKTAPMLRDAIARTSPHQAVADIKLVKLVAGARDGATWWSAELDVAITRGEPETGDRGGTAHVRVTELATSDAGWKVVAAAFSEPSALGMQRAAPSPIPSTTDAGPLSALVLGTKLHDALAADPSVTVFGTDKDESAYGPAAARALAAKWTHADVALQGKPREVRGTSWGFAIANVDLNAPGNRFPSRMAALVIAVPDGDAWRVVAAHYTAI